MNHPLVFLLAIAEIVTGVYYLVRKKELRKGWPSSVRFLFNLGFILALAFAIWYVVLLILYVAD